MTDFEPISPRDFLAGIELHGSASLREQFNRLTVSDPSTWPQLGPADTRVHRGALRVAGGFRPPAFNTLILGDLTVDGLLDCDDGYDAGGILVVVGRVACEVFASHFGKCTLIDGDLDATRLIINAFPDSALVVTGTLRTNFFYGWDIWAEVGGGAEMAFGEGYCLPIGYQNAAAEVIEPRHDIQASRRLLNVLDTDQHVGFQLLDLVRAGRSPFR